MDSCIHEEEEFGSGRCGLYTSCVEFILDLEGEENSSRVRAFGVYGTVGAGRKGRERSSTASGGWCTK